MKKIIAIFALLVLTISLASAQGQGPNNPGADMNDSQMTTQTQEPEQESEQPEDRMMQGLAHTPAEVREMIQQRQQEMQQQMEEMQNRARNVYQNQNRVRLAVHSLLAMKNMTGGIGPQVSEIAREFNNSVQETIQAEEQIQSKSGFARFFSGGNEKAAEQLEQRTQQNMERVQQLQQLREECNCSEDVKQLMQEQIQNMEQEQERLQQLAQKEKRSKGVFGWLWK